MRAISTTYFWLLLVVAATGCDKKEFVLRFTVGEANEESNGTGPELQQAAVTTPAQVGRAAVPVVPVDAAPGSTTAENVDARAAVAWRGEVDTEAIGNVVREVVNQELCAFTVEVGTKLEALSSEVDHIEARVAELETGSEPPTAEPPQSHLVAVSSAPASGPEMVLVRCRCGRWKWVEAR